MKHNLAKTFAGWEPIDERSKAYHKKGKLSDVYYLEIKKYKDQRNARLNAKYWVMLSEAVENSEKYYDTEVLHDDIKWILGITEMHENMMTGEVFKKVGSTNFENMTDEKFNMFYKDSISVVVKYILTGVNEQQLMDRVSSILRFS